MPELATRLPCPVCLGVMMERVGIGPEKRLMVDVCRRCGGAWLEHGTVQPLRAETAESLSAELVGPTPTHPGKCHSCHAPLDRDARQCSACGRANLIDCPRCDRAMRVVTDRGLRLDVCKECKGAWFDRHELASIWSPRFDAALARREMSRGDASMMGVGVVDELLFHSIFFGPDLVSLSAHGIDAVATGLPEAIAATPEIAAGAFEAIGEAAGSVFEAVVDIVGDLFS